MILIMSGSRDRNLSSLGQAVRQRIQMVTDRKRSLTLTPTNPPTNPGISGDWRIGGEKSPLQISNLLIFKNISAGSSPVRSAINQ